MVAKSSKKEHTKFLYDQLISHYHEHICDGSLPPGTRLPSDGELATEYQLSRDAVRQALAFLAAEGLIERIQGRGTFVRQQPAASDSIKLEQKQIGLVLNYGENTQLNMNVLIGVEQAAKLHGYSAVFSYAEEDEEQQARDIERLRANHVAGMIVYPVSNIKNSVAIQRLQAEHIPLVLIDRYLPELTTDYVGVDNRGAAYRATEHLLILGHKRIGFITSTRETLSTSSIYERWQGYKEALQRYGIPYDESLIVADFALGQSDTRTSIRKLLQRSDRPSAVFTANDCVALDVLQIANSLQLHIPEELALVGFDDLNFAALLHPPLTTVAQPFLDIGLRAATLLLSRIDGSSTPYKHIELPANLIVRESCGAQLHVKRTLSTSA